MHEICGLAIDKKIIATVNDVMLDILKASNGEKSIHDICEKVFNSNPEKFSLMSKSEYYEGIMQAIDMLEHYNIIKQK